MQPYITAYAIPGLKNAPGLPAPIPFKETYILSSVAEYFNITIEQLTSPSHKTVFVDPRHIAKYLLRQYTQLTLKQIGARFKSNQSLTTHHQDHTTVLHSIKVVKNWYQTRDEMADHINAIINKYL